jgi:DNA-directed RNA polymerase
MGNKRPQTTQILLKRLRRVAAFLDSMAQEVEADANPADLPQWRARANTCWQAAARLDELQARGAVSLPIAVDPVGEIGTEGPTRDE